MMFNHSLLKRVCYSHISIIKKYDMKNHNRFKNADKYIADHNFAKIKTYKDFCTMPEEVKNVQLTLTEEEDQYLQSTYLYQRQAIAWTKSFGLTPYRPDDHSLIEPIQGKTLISFISQAVKQRKPHQMLFIYGVVAAILNISIYFIFWYNAQADDYISNISLNPEFLQTYDLKLHCEPYAKEYKRKMGVQLQEILEIEQKLR